MATMPAATSSPATLHPIRPSAPLPTTTTTTDSADSARGNTSGCPTTTATTSTTTTGREKNGSLEITYSTISPKVEQQPPYPMHIKLNLIDQTSNGESSSCESPYPMTPMTPMTPGGSSISSTTGNGDLSKKQRHNLREQRRILRISNQFDILRSKLEAAGYSSSKKDKYSVLQATLDYITHLERNQTHPVARNQLAGLAHHHHHQPPPVAPPAGGSTPGARRHSAPTPTRLSITAPSPSNTMDKHGNTFMIDSMPSPVPALSMPGMQSSYPLDMESSMFAASAQNSHGYHVESIEGSSASYKDVFVNSSMPSLLAKLDGTIVEANSLFLELCYKNIDELRLHSLYTMCTATDAPKMYALVNKILSCEMASAQSKMMWHFSNTGDRKVFVSVSMIHDSMHRPANLHCSLLPLS